MFRADPAPWRSPSKGVCFSRVCLTSSSASEEGGRGPLWGPVLANPPPQAGCFCAVGARGLVWFNTQRQLWCGIRDFSNGLIPTQVPHRADARGHGGFSGGCSVNRCVTPWNCGMCWKRMERGFQTTFSWIKNGTSHGGNHGRALGFSRYWAKVSRPTGWLKERACVT